MIQLARPSATTLLPTPRHNLGDATCAINHPVLCSHLGLDVTDAKMVVVKTASNFQFFSRWRSGLIRVDSPGTTQSDLTAFTWKRLPRPIYPLDHPLADWRAISPPDG